MILVSRLNGSQLYINAELIQTVESTPDTIITLTTNVKMVVKESADIIVERMVAYQRAVRRTLSTEEGGSPEEEE